MREVIKQKDNPEITVHLYVENYDPNEYAIDFIFSMLPKITKASCTKLSGTSGEFILVMKQEAG
jgi:hypothetical protein